MTDNEIIKALKEMLERTLYEGELQRASIISKAPDLINRYRAEIKRLNNEVFAKEQECVDMQEQRDSVKKHLETAKAEAVKEFAERLKTMADGYDFCGDGVIYQMVDTDDIDNLVKEMTEQRKEDEGK